MDGHDWVLGKNLSTQLHPARLTGRTRRYHGGSSKRVGPKVVDETIKVARKFLEEHPEEMRKVAGVQATGKQLGSVLISRFLGWGKDRVSGALERIWLIEEGVIDREAVESMPTWRRSLFDGNHKRIASVCKWNWRRRLMVPTPSPSHPPKGSPHPYPSSLKLESSFG